MDIATWAGTVTIREKAFMPETLLHVSGAHEGVQVLLQTRDQGHFYLGAARTHIDLNPEDARKLAAYLIQLADAIEGKA